MSSLINTGALGELIKYTDNDSNEVRIVIDKIVQYYDVGESLIAIETVTDFHKFRLDSQLAVNAAIMMLDGKF